MKTTRIGIVGLSALVVLISLVANVGASITGQYSTFGINTNTTLTMKICYPGNIGQLYSCINQPIGPTQCFPNLNAIQNCNGPGIGPGGSATFPILIVMPATATNPNGTIAYFNHWQDGSTSSNYTIPLINWAPSPPATFTLFATYGPTPSTPGSVACDPLRIGWTGGLLGCQTGISNAYLIAVIGTIGVVGLVLATGSKKKLKLF